MTTQELRAVPGYEGLYSVTRDGRVWSHPKRPAAGKQGRVHDGHWMTPLTPPSQNGAAQIDLARDGRKHTMRIKKIVRLAWEGTDSGQVPSLFAACDRGNLPGSATGRRTFTTRRAP